MECSLDNDVHGETISVVNHWFSGLLFRGSVQPLLGRCHYVGSMNNTITIIYLSAKHITQTNDT